MLIDRITCRLHYENVDTANILKQLKINLSIGKALHLGFAQRQSDDVAYLCGQLAVR